jgi:hypothetical protein
VSSGMALPELNPNKLFKAFLNSAIKTSKRVKKQKTNKQK